MANIMLFGSSSISAIPQQVVDWIYTYINQGHTFIVGDRKGLDTLLHKYLSSLGAPNVQIYCMDNARNNVYDFPVKKFLTSYDEENKQVEVYAEDGSIESLVIDGIEKVSDISLNRQWYEFRDRQMIKDCDIAICLWDGETKTTTQIVQLLNINNKPCYTFTVK